MRKQYNMFNCSFNWKDRLSQNIITSLLQYILWLSAFLRIPFILTVNPLSTHQVRLQDSSSDLTCVFSCCISIGDPQKCHFSIFRNLKLIAQIYGSGVIEICEAILKELIVQKNKWMHATNINTVCLQLETSDKGIFTQNNLCVVIATRAGVTPDRLVCSVFNSKYYKEKLLFEEKKNNVFVDVRRIILQTPMVSSAAIILPKYGEKLTVM